MSGWGYLRPANGGTMVYDKIAVSGTVSGGKLDLDVSMGVGGFGFRPPFYLRGPIEAGLIASKLGIEGDTATHTALLERAPSPSEFTGTWALTSTTGDLGTERVTDTIVVSADGRARRHREWFFAGQPYWRYAMPVMLSRRGGWLIFDYLIENATDSLQIQSGEWVRSRLSLGGAPVTDHYTRVSRSTDLTPPSIPADSRQPAVASSRVSAAAATPR